MLKDDRSVDVTDLDYSRLGAADGHLIELGPPYVQESEYPDADDQAVPWWWSEPREDLRLRRVKILEQREVFESETIDQGQVVHYGGDRPIETARNGLTRIGTHSRYGFGELGVICIDEQ